jgi:hypothetical protein
MSLWEWAGNCKANNKKSYTEALSLVGEFVSHGGTGE